MYVQQRTGQARRSLVQFDLSGIPAGATINSATLELYASAVPTTGLLLDVHRITGTWTETGVTWTSQPGYNTTAEASQAGGTTVGWKTWNVLPTVQAWHAGTYPNYGFIVRSNLETGTPAYSYSFATRENGTAANRPILRINYTPVPGCFMNACTPTVTSPKPVPDGRVSGTPMLGSKATADGANLTITYDTATCTQADHSIIYGLLTGLNPITPTGGVCSIGNASPYAWNGSPAGNIWWVIVGDGGTTESSWGQQMAGGIYSERSVAASGQCGNTAIDVTGTCP